jgi:hypothetical protein
MSDDFGTGEATAARAGFEPLTSPVQPPARIGVQAQLGVTTPTNAIERATSSPIRRSNIRDRPRGTDTQDQDAEVGQQACGPDPSGHRIAQGEKVPRADGARLLADAHHAGRFGETGPLDFAFR